MNMRKIVVVGGFAAGAAFVLAPLASADTDPLAPLVSSEIASMNFLFEGDAFLAGDSADVVKHAGSFDTIPLADAPKTDPTFLDYLLYGLNPVAAGPASDPGAYNVYNGAMVQFDDGINSLLHAMSDNGAVLDWDSGDLFGGNSAMDIANSAGSGWEEAANYLSFAWGDLMGYFGIFDS
ncbi:hypothetical protein [Mycolicibacter heraklionensis]|uniref:hypothetical protein n=1 Tax=Mycolicibacter heraklionensis TaxID=512402 RepID=UPI0007EAF12C|nr:hypothetical protein [Mycolicibacter heraklionensis]OBG40275.1 hypothetical protein A5671_14860 [Mycolicibacter heraklionensis]